MRRRVTTLSPKHAGNYVNTIPFLPADYAKPSLFRRALNSAMLRGHVVHNNRPLPWFGRKTLLPTLALVNNWASLYQDVELPGNHSIRHQPVFGGGRHCLKKGQQGFPLPFETIIIYRPRLGSISLMRLGAHLGLTAERLAALAKCPRGT